MPFFHYRAISGDGAVIKGTIYAVDENAAQSAVETGGQVLISLRPMNAHAAALVRWYSSRQVKRKDIIEFSNNMSVMIRAGIPILTAISDITDTMENRYFRERLTTIRNDISMGMSFSGALGAHSDIFPDIFIRLSAVGEETGNLDGSLADAASHLQRVEDLASAIKRAMVYPAFALVSATGALVFWLVYVLPKILKIFVDMDIEIPAVTRLLMVMSEVTQRYWPMLLVVPASSFLLLRFLRRYPAAARAIDMAKLRTPILKLILSNKILGLFAEQMRILNKAGLTIDRSFELVAEVIGNVVYRNAIQRARESVMAGSTISEAMREQNIFPAMLLRMVHIGETSGTLDEQFAFLSEHYIRKLDDLSQRLGKMLEPVIIIFLGLMFAVIIIGLLLPIYELVSRMGMM